MKMCVGTDGNGMAIYKDVVGDLDIGATNEDKNNDARTDRERKSSSDAGGGETACKDS